MCSAQDDYSSAREYLEELFHASNPQASCLSVAPHSLKDVRDLRCHFFGCLGYDERIEVLDDESHSFWSELREMETLDNGNTEETKSETRNSQPEPVHGKGGPQDFSVRYISALSLQAELKRITVLRRTPALRESVRELRDSIQEWVRKNKENIQDIRQRRINSHTFGARDRPEARQPSVRTECVLESDDVLPEFSKKLREIVEQERKRNSKREPEKEPIASGYDIKRDIKARLIKLKRPEELASNGMIPVNELVDDEVFKGTFPDQQVSVFWLLEEKFKRIDKTNLAWEERLCVEQIQYFHIPVNNMSWVEEAIASYFDEKKTNPSENLRLGRRARSVLNDSCWKGQEHGGGPDSVVHNRNLRPICEKITIDEEPHHDLGNANDSLVLFMPFLHWETDRRRSQAANLINQLTDEHELDKRETAKLWKTRRKEDRKTIFKPENFSRSAPLSYQEPDYYGSNDTRRDEIFHKLAQMLWRRLCDDPSKEVPPGLAHILWQTIRDEDHNNKLLTALKSVVDEFRVENMPPILSPLFFESKGDSQELRDWQDILWQLKAAGRNRRMPHALEDVFWEAIKSARRQAENEKNQRDGENRGNADKFRSRNIFQKPTTIFKGVETDEHGVLQPRTLLAQLLVKAARLYEQMKTYPDQQILEQYLFKNPPLHPRRTLDQAYFWRLRNTRLRDRDQVVYRYTNAAFVHKYRPQPLTDFKDERSIIDLQNRSSRTEDSQCLGPKQTEEQWAWTGHGQYEEDNGCDQCNEDIKKISRAIMVDQLWIWVLDNDTILTCFPQRYGISEKDPSGVHQAIRTRVKTRSNPDNHIYSVFDVALIVLDECFNALFNRTKTADARPQVLDVFAESIGHVINKQAIAFQHLWNLSERQIVSEENVDPSLLGALLNISFEADLQREIRDIIDELDIMLHIVQQQQDMIARFVNFARQIMQSRCTKFDEHRRLDDRPIGYGTIKKQAQEMNAKAEILIFRVADRIKEIDGLRKSAESTAENVDDLLGLKQQQAGIVQAYEAMKQGEETVRQGKAIMVFTVMTIIFLPLSFMTSIFGMNNVEESGGSDSSGSVTDEIVPFWPTTFKRQILIMFTVSFGAVLIVLIPAFSPFIRAVTHSVLARSLTKAIIWSRAYHAWLAIGWDSKRIRDNTESDVRKMKEEVKEQMSARRLKLSEIWDGVRGADGELLPKTPHASKEIINMNRNSTVTPNGATERSPSDLEKGIRN